MRNRTTPMLKRDAGPGRPKGSKNKLTKERVEQELRHLAFSDPLAMFIRTKKNARTWRLRAIDEMTPEMRRAIGSVKVKTENLTAGDGEQDTTVEVKLWDKTKALQLCAQALGMLKEVHVIEGLDERKARLRKAFALPTRGDE